MVRENVLENLTWRKFRVHTGRVGISYGKIFLETKGGGISFEFLPYTPNGNGALDLEGSLGEVLA